MFYKIQLFSLYFKYYRECYKLLPGFRRLFILIFISLKSFVSVFPNCFSYSINIILLSTLSIYKRTYFKFNFLWHLTKHSFIQPSIILNIKFFNADIKNWTTGESKEKPARNVAKFDIDLIFVGNFLTKISSHHLRKANFNIFSFFFLFFLGHKITWHLTRKWKNKKSLNLLTKNCYKIQLVCRCWEHLFIIWGHQATG